MNRTDRLLAIVIQLQAKGWQRAEDLAAVFEISKRTIYRDMLALMESGVPVISSPGQGYALDAGYFLPPLSFTADEATVLLLGAEVMIQNFDDQYRRAARSATSKIQAVLGDNRREEVDALLDGMRFIAQNPLEADQPERLQTLRRAILRRQSIRITYHTRHRQDVLAGDQTVREVDPYALAHIDQSWYLVGFDHLRRAVRYFRLDRVDDLNLLPRHFLRPADFQMDERHSNDRALQVSLLFSPQVARWVREERYFFVTAMVDQPDGLRVTLQVRQEQDVLGWILKWGAQVRVLEPASLQQRVLAAAEAIQTVYR